MKKIIRLTESDLTRIVKRVIKETSESGFSDWLTKQSGFDAKGVYCVAVQDCLDNNNYKNYDDAPEKFKGLVRVSNCFYNGRGKLRDKVLGAMRTLNTSDTTTETLLNCLSKNNF